jgi:ACS family tartrate transporter-like MFS transporter
MVGPLWSMPTTFLSGTAAAAGIALINSIGNLGGFFGPSIIGWVRNSTGQFRGGLLVIGGTLTISGLVALVVRFHGHDVVGPSSRSGPEAGGIESPS